MTGEQAIELSSSALKILAPLGETILRAILTPEMTPEQVAALDAELAQQAIQARKDIFDAARLQRERNAAVDEKAVEKFGPSFLDVAASRGKTDE